MSFDLDWLDLREPADHAARAPGLLAAACDWLAATDAPVSVDLGAGSGSTLRAFGQRARAVRWRLVDRDEALLAAALARAPCAEAVAMDLSDVAGLPIAGARLVTASALFDLASRDWIERLADRIAAEGAGLYAALSYDGTMAWDPAERADAGVVAAFGRHQRRDKGFGPALGPEAGHALAAAMRARGYRLETAPSPWRLGPGPLQAALVAGVAAAAADAGCADAADWGERRAGACAQCVVGHLDVLALP